MGRTSARHICKTLVSSQWTHMLLEVKIKATQCKNNIMGAEILIAQVMLFSHPGMVFSLSLHENLSSS